MTTSMTTTRVLARLALVLALVLMLFVDAGGATDPPTVLPTVLPSLDPTLSPTVVPSITPTHLPSVSPTINPTLSPTIIPTVVPSVAPTMAPSAVPTVAPSLMPTLVPTAGPTPPPTVTPTVAPSFVPTFTPSAVPTTAPTVSPSVVPTVTPSAAPTVAPSAVPSVFPSASPTVAPTVVPSVAPSVAPSEPPTVTPSVNPSSTPSVKPTVSPTPSPTSRPSSQPSSGPTSTPSTCPSSQPTTHPSARPSSQPSSRPTLQPVGKPTSLPSTQPSASPTLQITCSPTSQPSSEPSSDPSSNPTGQPSWQPSSRPSAQPTAQPSRQPTNEPSGKPTTQPSAWPTNFPTKSPESLPTSQPSTQPSGQPTGDPSGMPTGQPSRQPAATPSSVPTSQPSTLPSLQPSSQPTEQPSSEPSGQPSSQPSSQPTGQPSGEPSGQPSSQPSSQPTGQPSGEPSGKPSSQPSSQPTGQPSGEPSGQPSMQPTMKPSGVPSGQPTAQPSGCPTSQPTKQPSDSPTGQPTEQPSGWPTSQPSSRPTSMPSTYPTDVPTLSPESLPTARPTAQPSVQPSSRPSSDPTVQPSACPTSVPTRVPVSAPTSQPTSCPSARPSTQPTCQPSRQPSSQPSSVPTTQPLAQPTSQPSTCPTAQPTGLPTSQPSSQPTSQPTTRGAMRYIDCNGGYSPCESSSTQNCVFDTGNITFVCQSPQVACLVAAGTLTIGPNTAMYVQGNCSLDFFTQSWVRILVNTTIMGQSLNITSGGNITISGRLSSSGLGPLQGPGSPTARYVGATYGGSGGYTNCSGAFSNSMQIGSVDVRSDYTLPVEVNPTWGSGGGFDGGGRGGGRISLAARRTIRILSSGSVLAEGSAVTGGDAGTGAGSGGSISISAWNVTINGIVSVRGGAGKDASPAGGGGRIVVALSVSSGKLQYLPSHMIVEGGIYEQDDAYHARCMLGAPGTLFVVAPARSGGSSYSSSLYIYNLYNRPLAITTVDTVPSTTELLSVENNVIFTGTNQMLTMQDQCTAPSVSAHDGCSMVSISNSTFVCAQNVTAQANCSMSADVIEFTNARAEMVSEVGATSFTSKTFLLDATSSLFYSTFLSITGSHAVNLQGSVKQVSTGSTAEINLFSSTNVSVGSLSADRLIIDSGDVFVRDLSIIQSTDHSNDTCAEPVDANLLMCNYADAAYSRVIVIKASGAFELGNASSVIGSTVFICAETALVSHGAVVSANASGCIAGTGLGPGLSATAFMGGGGGGHGGVGGVGQDNPLSGGAAVYNSSDGNTTWLYSGSGGGCYPSPSQLCNGSSVGGGVISIRATETMVLDGALSAVGGSGLTSAGGGAGGSVSMLAAAFSGHGTLSADGGVGGCSSSYSGGGGGGGFLQVSSTTSDYSDFTFSGAMTANGGLAGCGFSAAQDSQMSAWVIPTSVLASASFFPLSSSPASAGAIGVVSLPTCAAGYGNDPSTGAVCQICPVGTYNTGQGGSCTQCTNAPTHSFYIDSGVGTSTCPYVCEDGYSTDNCYNPFQKFLFDTLGWGGMSGVVVGIFAIVLVPLFAFRYKRKLDADRDLRMLKGSTDFLKTPALNDLGFGFNDQDHMYQHDAGRSPREFTSDNPIHAHSQKHIGADDRRKTSSIRSLYTKGGRELRREHRMVDQDLPFHAVRVNLMGCNHPFASRGGPWILPTKRPPCVRPMMLREEYRVFAEQINAIVAWNSMAEILIVIFVTLLAPPLLATVQRMFRRRRADQLLSFVAAYDYACFRSSVQRKARNSLRIGISPDCTLAYLDFLFDEEHFSTKCRPLCPIGQAKLPAAFKIAGLGSYSSPYYVDTNDLILQAVPQTDVASAFIDAAWINFVVELNMMLRTVQRDAIYMDILRLVRFLGDEKNTALLGGLTIEFCTFVNVPQSDDDQAASATPSVRSDSADQSVYGGDQVQTYHREADSFVAQRARRRSFEDTSASNGWLVGKLKDVLDITKRSPTPAEGAVEVEMHGHDHQTPAEDPSFALPTQSEAVARSTQSSSSSSCCQSTRTWLRGLWTSLRSFVELSVLDCMPHPNPCGDPVMSLALAQPRTFSEMCENIKEGKLMMGIVVSHPKVLDDTRRPFDASATPALATGASVRDGETKEAGESGESSAEDDDDEENDDGGGIVRAKSWETLSSVTAANEEDGEEEGGERAPRGSFASQISESGEVVPEALQRIYRDKADEMARFYRIVHAANSSNVSVASSPAATEASPVFAAVMESPLARLEGRAQSDPEGPRSRSASARLTRDPAASFVYPDGQEPTYTELFQTHRDSTTAARDPVLSVDRLGGVLFGFESLLGGNRPPSPGEQPVNEGATLGNVEIGTEQVVRSDSEVDPVSQAMVSPKAKGPAPVAISKVSRSGRRKATLTGTQSDKTRKKKRDRRASEPTQDHGLAPSCFQESTLAWHYRDGDAGLPYSDGLLGHHMVRNPPAAAATATSTVDGGGDLEMGGKHMAANPLCTPTQTAPTPDVRESISESPTVLQALYRMSLYHNSCGPLQETRPSPSPIAPPAPLEPMRERKPSRADTAPLQPVAESSVAGNQCSLEPAQPSSVVQWWQFVKVNNFFLHYITRFMLGFNVHPHGPRWLRKMLEGVIFALCLSDLCLWGITLFDSYCASADFTDCENHDVVVMLVSIWPMAFIVAPISGLATVILGPSSTQARIYAWWSRLAALNNLVLIIATIHFFDYYQSTTGSFYPVICISISRFLQCGLVDLYVAHIERMRYTRGWDGLHTSLFKTTDNKQEIAL